MDNPDTRPIVQPSAGIHIILPSYYSPRSMGMLDPATSDGRVIFFLPWEGERACGLVDVLIRAHQGACILFKTHSHFGDIV